MKLRQFYENLEFRFALVKAYSHFGKDMTCLLLISGY